MAEDAAAIHLQQAVAGNHLLNPQVPARIKLDAKGLLQQRLGGRNVHRILRPPGHKVDALSEGGTWQKGEKEKGAERSGHKKGGGRRDEPYFLRSTRTLCASLSPM